MKEESRVPTIASWSGCCGGVVLPCIDFDVGVADARCCRYGPYPLLS